MDKPSDLETVGQSAQSPEPGLANFTYVGILLVVIIGLLAVLWTRDRRLLSTERSLRMAAEQRSASLQQENQTLRQAMGAIGAFRNQTTQPGGTE